MNNLVYCQSDYDESKGWYIRGHELLQNYYLGLTLYSESIKEIVWSFINLGDKPEVSHVGAKTPIPTIVCSSVNTLWSYG